MLCRKSYINTLLKLREYGPYLISFWNKNVSYHQKIEFVWASSYFVVIWQYLTFEYLIVTSYTLMPGGCPVIRGNKWSSTKWMRVGEYSVWTIFKVALLNHLVFVFSSFLFFCILFSSCTPRRKGDKWHNIYIGGWLLMFTLPLVLWSWSQDFFSRNLNPM